MSTLKIEVVKINEVKEHPNADALEIVIVNGWQSVVRKDSFKAGDLAVYFPLDSVLPERLSDAIGVTNYLSKGRVRAAKLRGESSFGLLWNKLAAENYIYPPPFDYRSFGEGTDLAEGLGVTKWVPPMNYNVEDAEQAHPNFFRYTDIENMRNYPNVITEGDEVVFTEKIHGTNSRHAFIDGVLMAGGHNVRFKENDKNKVWHIFSNNMKEMLKWLSENNHGADVIMYGEVFGDKVQDLKYGLTKGKIEYRCFDISINGKYMGYSEWFLACTKFQVPMVPVLYRGSFSLDKILSLQNSQSSIEDADNIMEGVVVRVCVDRTDSSVGRVILKYVFDQYLNRHGGTEFR